MLECLHDGFVRLPENRCIHREVYLTRTALIWEQEYPVPTQGCQECLDVKARVEFDGEDVRAMRKAPHLDPLALVEAVNEGSALAIAAPNRSANPSMPCKASAAARLADASPPPNIRRSW